MPYLILPANVKPSKVLSKDKGRPLLCSANLQETPEGGWELAVCDGFKLARVPLEINGSLDDVIVAGEISADALRAIEKGAARAFTANGTVTPRNRYGSVAGPSFPRNTALGEYPNLERLTPDKDPAAFSIGLNAKYLHELAMALGSDVVQLTFTIDAAGVPMATRPMHVASHLDNGGRGVLMPVHKP